MRKSLESRYDSQVQTYMVLEKNQSKFAAIPVFVSAFENLGVLNQQASALMIKIENIPNRVAANKELAREELIAVAKKLSNPIKLYATKTKDQNMLSSLVTSESVLLHMRGQDLINYATFLRDYIESNMEPLAGFGITAELLAELKTELEDYSGTHAEPRSLISERKTNNELLEDTIQEASVVCREELDSLMELFIDDREFYLEYKAARMIVDRASRSRSTDSENTEE